MPRARKFAEYELPGVAGHLESAEPIERSLREPRADRDLLLTNDTDDGKSAA